MFVKQATTDRLLGMLVTLATAGALYFIQHRLKLFMGSGRRRGGGGDRRRGGRAAKKTADYGDPYFRARWGSKRGLGLELVQHKGQCMCGRFCFRLLAPPEIRALDCPGRIRYPHIFVPAGAFTPLSDLRLLTLYSARSALVSHVVVHAFCSACGVPVFRASDGAIDTLVVNIECLASEGIRSLEVSYYEDLLGFPPEDSQQQHQAAAAAAGGGGGGGQPPAYAAKQGAAPFSSASKGPRRTSPFRPPPAPPAATSTEEATAGTIVPASRAAGRGGGGEGWTGVLPTRLFGARSIRNGSSGFGLGGVVRMSGATSLLSHLLSRASLATTAAANNRPPRALLRQRAVEEEEDEEELEMAASAAAAAAAAAHAAATVSSSNSNMWRAWDESCEVRNTRRGAGSAAAGGRSYWGDGGGSSSLSRPGSAASVSTVGTAGAASSLGGGALTVAARGGGMGSGSFTNTSNFYRAASQGKGWERLTAQGCTPPSMHQLRYHLKRHIKRRMNWLHDPDFAALCLDSDDDEEGQEAGQQHYQYQHRPYQPPNGGGGPRRLAEEEEQGGGEEYSYGSTSSGAASPAPSEEPHPSTPLGDRTGSYANHHQGSDAAVGKVEKQGQPQQQQQREAAASVGGGTGEKAASSADRRRGGSASRKAGRENEAPATATAKAGGVMPIAPPVGLSEKGKKED